MLFFTGAMPLFVLGRAKKYTTTVLLPLSALMVGWGAMRIGQMTAFSFFASMIPGIIMGMIFSIPFLILAIIEEKIEGRYALRIV